nr:hypothetical transcript [Hymenolepis microstoma]
MALILTTSVRQDNLDQLAEAAVASQLDAITDRLHKLELLLPDFSSRRDRRRSRLTWSERLPIILLAIINTIKEDLGCGPAGLVLGTTLSLPGEMIFDFQNKASINPLSYSARVKGDFRSVRPLYIRPYDKLVHIHKELSTYPLVSIRVDTVIRPLQPPFDGPHKVL